MNKNVTAAVARLQAMLGRTSAQRSSDLIDEALNYLLNQPDNIKPPHVQARNALREARRKLTVRGELMGAHLEREHRATGAPQRDFEHAKTELRDFIAALPKPTDRPLLRIAMAGGGAETIARQFDIKLASARERLSRARSRAWPLWIN